MQLDNMSMMNIQIPRYVQSTPSFFFNLYHIFSSLQESLKGASDNESDEIVITQFTEGSNTY